MTADGLPGVLPDERLSAGAVPAGAPVAAAGSASASSAAGAASGAGGGSSTTNDQETGADEPDVVKTDGDRVVTLTGGVLRVLDARTRRLTGSLDLSLYAGSDGAQLLVRGDRALVVLASDGGGSVRVPAGVDLPYRPAGGAGFLLVRLTGTPAVVGTFRPDGGYVGARLVGGTIRLVVTSVPRLTFPQPNDAGGSVVANRAVARRAPVGAWLPRWTESTGATTTSGQVGCGDVATTVSSLTGTATTTVYSVDPARGFTDLAPVSVAAASTAIYATDRSLYLLDSDTAGGTDGAGAVRTEIHRFDITTAGRPRYVASGAVAGQLLSSYSLSDAGGFLRVVTTTGGTVDAGLPIPAGERRRDTSSTTLSVLDATTLRRVGHVDGLGRAEQVYAVRFVGDLGFVVTFRQRRPPARAGPARSPAPTSRRRAAGRRLLVLPASRGRRPAARRRHAGGSGQRAVRAAVVAVRRVPAGRSRADRPHRAAGDGRRRDGRRPAHRPLLAGRADGGRAAGRLGRQRRRGGAGRAGRPGQAAVGRHGAEPGRQLGHRRHRAQLRRRRRAVDAVPGRRAGERR